MVHPKTFQTLGTLHHFAQQILACSMYFLPTLQRVVSTQWSHENEHHNMALPCKVSKIATYLGATLQHLFPHHLDTNSSCGHGGKHVKISQTSTIRMTLSLCLFFAAHVFLRFELDALTSPVSWSSNSWRPGSEVVRASYEYLGKTRKMEVVTMSSWSVWSAKLNFDLGRCWPSSRHFLFALWQVLYVFSIPGWQRLICHYVCASLHANSAKAQTNACKACCDQIRQRASA